MTGPQHYYAAELLLGVTVVPEGMELSDLPAPVRRAQVHATLALTAATALGTEYRRASERAQWQRVAGIKPPDGPAAADLAAAEEAWEKFSDSIDQAEGVADERDCFMAGWEARCRAAS